MVNVFPSLFPTNVVMPCTSPCMIASHLKRLWLQKKRMPYFSDNRSRLRREEEDEPEDRDAHVRVEAQQEAQAAVPVPSDDAKDDDDGDLSDYYSYDELVTDDKLIDQENEAYEMLTSMF